MSRKKVFVIVAVAAIALWAVWAVGRMSTSTPPEDPNPVSSPTASEPMDTTDGPPLIEPLPPELSNGVKPVAGYDWTVEVPAGGLFLLPLPAEAETNPNTPVEITVEDPSLAEVAPPNSAGEGVLVASPIGGVDAYSGQVWQASETVGQTSIKIVSPGGTRTVLVIIKPEAR